MFALYPWTQNKETRAAARALAYQQNTTAVDALISEVNSDVYTRPREGYVTKAAQRKTVQEETRVAVLAQWEAEKW